MTWSLNIASPLTSTGGADWLGVFIHSVGPVLLFVVVEAAAAFQHKIGLLIAEKTSALNASDAKRRKEQAERVEMADRIRRLTADLEAAGRRDVQYAEEVASVRRELSVAQADVDVLRAASERLVSAHAEEVAKVRAEAREAIATVKAEARTLRLDDYRSGGARKAAQSKRRGGSEAPQKTALSHEEAVQKCLAEHPEPNFEWTQSEIVRITGCGWGRAPKLLAALTEAHAGGSGGSASTGRTEGASDDEEDSLAAASA
jgi:hypothetical protein